MGSESNGTKLSQKPLSSRRRSGSIAAYEPRFPWIPAFAGMTDRVDESAFPAYLSAIRVRVELLQRNLKHVHLEK